MLKQVNEESCVFTHAGIDYTARGAWLNEQGGAVYMVERDRVLRAETWNGEILSHKVQVVSEWACHSRHLGRYRMRSVRFVIDGVTYSGRYGYDWAQLCRVKAVRS